VALRVDSPVIDGEAVHCDDAGVVVFDRIHSRANDDEVFLYAFDLLELDGRGLAPAAARGAQGQAAEAAHRGARAGVQFSEHLDGDGATILV